MFSTQRDLAEIHDWTIVRHYLLFLHSLRDHAHNLASKT